MKQHGRKHRTFSQRFFETVGVSTGVHTALDVLVLADVLVNCTKLAVFVLLAYFAVRPFLGAILSYMREE